MDILGIDVCKPRLDGALLLGERCRQAVFANTEVGFGELLRWLGQHLAELPNIAEFTPKALAAFAGLSPQEHSSGTSIRRPGRISRMGSERLRRALYMCSLSSKLRNLALIQFVQRIVAMGKPPKVILLAIARKLLIFAYAIVRTQKPFNLMGPS